MSLRLMTYNILDGGVGRENYILKVIQQSQPDIVVLQEVISEEILKFLALSLCMDYYIGGSNKKRKVALLSKLLVRSFTSEHPIFPVWRNFISAELEWKEQQVVRLIGVHSIAMLGLPFEVWRLWEAKYILRYIHSTSGERSLIAGDFNAIAPGERVQIQNMPSWLKWMLFFQGNRVFYFSIKEFLSAGFIDCFRFCNPTDKGFTLPPENPNARLDYVFASEGLKCHVKSAMVIDRTEEAKLASDHLPVLVDFFD
jgi:endonuclease/exonuclease/phosphatase family metal-dependent hydrolase